MELLVFQDPAHRILWANRAAAEYAGITPEKLKGRACYEVLSHRATPCEECPVAKALQSGVPEEGIVTLQGDRQFLVRGYPVKGEGGLIEGIVEACMDITERVQAERAFSTVFDSVHDAIFLHDLDGKIIDVNRTMLEMYGVNSKEEA
jgi:PAS domain S-box-containing protein